MNTKILVSLLVIGLTAIAIGGSMTGAFFSDQSTSSDNKFTAGSLNLQMSNDGTAYTDTITQTMKFANMVPGDNATGKICFMNTGTIAGNVAVNMNYDSTSDVAFAKNLAVTEAYIEGSAENKAPYWARQIVDYNWYNSSGTSESEHYAAAVGDGSIVQIGGVYYPTAYGLQWITLYFWQSYTNHAEYPLLINTPVCENLKVNFYESGANQNALMGKSVTVTITGNLRQIGAP
jgi:predicted ribosomally synthesized peptide with SipW-like signal peptide